HANAGLREIARDRDTLRPRLALGEHERLELIAREIPRHAKHRDVEILVERDLARLQRAIRLLMPVLIILGVEAERFDRLVALLVIPAVRAEHAADVEQREVDARRHPT